jgi:cardiolipin synthase
MKKKYDQQENIWNVPNFLTLLRVLITFVIIYMIFQDKPLLTIAIIFTVGMITDALDGYIARKYNQKTEFGRKFDMIADRFLLIGTVISIVISNLSTGYFNHYDLKLIALVLSREIISFPFAIILFYSTPSIPQVRVIGKIVTVLQSISFPMVLLKWDIAIYFAGITSIIGLVSAGYYVYDSINLAAKPKKDD